MIRLLLALAFFIPNVLSAQWSKLHSFDGFAYSIYFLEDQGHPEIGFVGIGPSFADSAQVLRTTDGGKTWKPCVLNVHRQSFPNAGGVTQFTFKDNFTGWCIFGSPEVLKTTDGGLTWDSTSAMNPISGALVSIYYSCRLDKIWMCCDGPPSIESDDEGLNWHPFIDGERWGITFLSDSIGVVSGESLVLGDMTHTPLYRTTDGGKTWIATSFYISSYQPAASKLTHTFYADDFETGRFYRSRDSGVTWQERTPIDTTTTNGYFQNLETNCLQVTGCGEVAGQTLNGHGMKLSSDDGATWYSIGGPSNFQLKRFQCTKSAIYALSNNGDLWKLDLANIRPLISSSNFSLTAGSCTSVFDTSIVFTTFANCLGTGTSLLSARISGSSSFVFRDSLSFPRPLLGFDTIHFLYVPHHATDSAWLVLTLEVNGSTYDTTILFLGSINPNVAITHLVIGNGSTVAPGQPTSVPLRMETDVPVSNQLDSISCSAVFDGDVLDVTNVTAGKWAVSSWIASQGRVDVKLRRLNPGIISSTDTLANIIFVGFIAKNDFSRVTLQNVLYNDGLSYQGCTELSESSIDTATIQITDNCGDSSLRDLLDNTSLFAVLSIIPNPASSKLNVVLKNNSKQSITYQLFSTLGNIVRQGATQTSLQMNVSTLPSGNYYLRMSTAGFVETRRVVLQR